MSRLIGSLQQRPDGWWILIPELGCPDHGPYGRREEAQDDLMGLRRIYYEHRRFWDGLDKGLDAATPPGYNNTNTTPTMMEDHDGDPT